MTAGQPTVYCQTPGGKVLHRQDDYAGGAVAAVAALRKAKDTYEARRDPDLRRWFLSLLHLPELIRPFSIAAAAFIGLALFRILRR